MLQSLVSLNPSELSYMGLSPKASAEIPPATMSLTPRHFHRNKRKTEPKNFLTVNSLPNNCTYLATWNLTDSPACTADVNLTPVCKAVLRSLFWAFSGLNELPEVIFEFSFTLIGKLTINYGFLTGPQIPIHS